MTVSANIGSSSLRSRQIIDGTHQPVTRDYTAVADQGVLRAGLLVSRNAGDEVIPYQGGVQEVIGTGDGSIMAFDGVATGGMIHPGSITITDGTQVLTDDGRGALGGDGSGSVNYKTGKVSVTFDAAPGAGVDVSIIWANRLVGVLLREMDTATNHAALVIVHGTVVKDGLLLSDDTTPSQTDIDRLVELTIYPR
ncbi:MAG: hypothetical protein HQL53_09730 [Magnetococcales bacterium]|nr:hypothetical protein [Magnetococcales bacterium]